MADKRIGPVWVTKYALSKCILVYADVEDCGGGMIRTDKYTYFHGEGREWHRTEAEAMDRAGQMRLKRIKSLEQKLAKMRNLNIKILDEK